MYHPASMRSPIDQTKQRTHYYLGLESEIAFLLEKQIYPEQSPLHVQ